jgi:hypothetical protein
MGCIAVVCRTICTLMPRPAELRLEGGLYVGHEPAETDRHLFKHMIAADAQLVAENLQVRMAIAQVPGQAEEIKRVSALDLGERFKTAAHAHDRSIVEHETVAIPQHSRVRQIKQKAGAALRGQHETPTMPIVGAENHAIDSGRVPLTCRFNFAR